MENLRLLAPYHHKTESLETTKEKLNAGPLRNNFYAAGTNDPEPDIRLSPLIMVGNVVLPALLNTVLCQTYFNEHLIQIVEKLLESNCLSTKLLSNKVTLFPECSK